MEKTLKDIVQYVRKNYFSYWVILGIDTAISVLCSLVAYAVIHYMAHVPMTTGCSVNLLAFLWWQVLRALYYSILIVIQFVSHRHVNFGVSCVPFYLK